MEVTLVDRMGDDQTVVNAARVSFGKFKKAQSFEHRNIGRDSEKRELISIIDKYDTKLVNFLAKHNHWSPFGHPQLQFHIKAPIFVARQLGKHQVGLVWNEISRRYVDSTPEFFIPEGNMYRKRAANKKQGSSDEVMNFSTDMYYEYALDIYNDMLEKNVAPELARMILPQSMYTEWYWSGSLYAFARVCKLRIEETAQKETREIAEMIAKECEKMFPVSWNALFPVEVDSQSPKRQRTN